MKRITSYLTLFLAISGISYAQIVMRIDDDANDAEEHINTPEFHGLSYWPQGYTIISSSDIEVGAEGDGGLDWQAVGLQWDQLGIPQGSTIDSAKITLQYDDGGNDGDPGLTIFADDVDNSATFEGLAPDASSPLPDPASHNITARARTAGVAWAPPLTTDDDIGTFIDTPDLSALVQAIVDRPGWSDNNMLSFMIIPDAYLAAPGGSAVAVRESEFEADGAPSDDQAVLTINFTAPAAPPPPEPGGIETEIAVPVDAATSYIEPLEDLPNSGDPLGWTAIGYDTSQDDGKGDAGNGSANWQAGILGVGYGDGDDSTLIDDDDDIFGIYTRTEFTITSASRVVEMRWQVSFDDGYVAYVNGVEIARINQSDSPATWNSLASDVVGDAGALSPASVVDHSMLVDGTNVLAVHNMNNQTGSSDLTMIPRLAVDIGPPAVSSIDRVGSSTEAFDSGTGQWTVTFTEDVENVSDDDFLAVRTGDAASDEATIVSGGTTGTVFTVQVTGVTGVEGSLGLDFTGTDVVTVSDGSAIGAKTGQKFVLGSANVPALGLLGLGLAGGVIAAIGASVARRRKD